ncbi:MAG TPA: VOC family protein [Chloroflexota bacterium]|nr:VOC family protein [Chloroflexota bacterium]
MATPIRTRKVSHVVLNVSDVERSIKFYTEILGFKLSDRNAMGMAFLRNGTDHHTIGFAQGPKDGTGAPTDRYLTFHHLALEVDRVEDLFKAREFLRERGIEIEFEGRRGPGSNIGIEFRDPDGYAIELTCEMEQIGWNDSARPVSMHRRASSLEEAVANPMPDPHAVGATA